MCSLLLLPAKYDRYRRGAVGPGAIAELAVAAVTPAACGAVCEPRARVGPAGDDATLGAHMRHPARADSAC